MSQFLHRYFYIDLVRLIIKKNETHDVTLVLYKDNMVTKFLTSLMMEKLFNSKNTVFSPGSQPTSILHGSKITKMVIPFLQSSVKTTLKAVCIYTETGCC